MKSLSTPVTKICERVQKRKMEWFGVVTGHIRPLAMSPLHNSAHNFLFNFNKIYASVLYHFGESC